MRDFGTDISDTSEEFILPSTTLTSTKTVANNIVLLNEHIFTSTVIIDTTKNSLEAVIIQNVHVRTSILIARVGIWNKINFI